MGWAGGAAERTPAAVYRRASVLAEEPQADDPDHDQRDRGDLARPGGLVQQHDAGDGRPHRADPRPCGVGAAHRQGAKRQREQHDAARTGGEEAKAGPQLREALRLLEQHRPDDLEQTGDGDHGPGHAIGMVPGAAAKAPAAPRGLLPAYLSPYTAAHEREL